MKSNSNPWNNVLLIFLLAFLIYSVLIGQENGREVTIERLDRRATQMNSALEQVAGNISRRMLDLVNLYGNCLATSEKMPCLEVLRIQKQLYADELQKTEGDFYVLNASAHPIDQAPSTGPSRLLDQPCFKHFLSPFRNQLFTSPAYSFPGATDMRRICFAAARRDSLGKLIAVAIFQLKVDTFFNLVQKASFPPHLVEAAALYNLNQSLIFSSEIPQSERDFSADEQELFAGHAVRAFSRKFAHGRWTSTLLNRNDVSQTVIEVVESRHWFDNPGLFWIVGLALLLLAYFQHIVRNML